MTTHRLDFSDTDIGYVHAPTMMPRHAPVMRTDTRRVMPVTSYGCKGDSCRQGRAPCKQGCRVIPLKQPRVQVDYPCHEMLANGQLVQRRARRRRVRQERSARGQDRAIHARAVLVDRCRFPGLGYRHGRLEDGVMSRTQANRMAGALLGCLFVLAVNACGAQIDAERDLNDVCSRFGKQYSHQHRACVRPQR